MTEAVEYMNFGVGQLLWENYPDMIKDGIVDIIENSCMLNLDRPMSQRLAWLFQLCKPCMPEIIAYDRTRPGLLMSYAIRDEAVGHFIAAGISLGENSVLHSVGRQCFDAILAYAERTMDRAAYRRTVQVAIKSVMYGSQPAVVENMRSILRRNPGLDVTDVLSSLNSSYEMKLHPFDYPIKAGGQYYRITEALIQSVSAYIANGNRLPPTEWYNAAA